MTKPEAVPNKLVCSVCGLDWSAHKRKTLDECVRLLKTELVKRPHFAQYGSSANVASVQRIA